MNQLTPIPQGHNSPIRSKGDVFRILSNQITLNQYHLPDHIYRVDLIPEDILDSHKYSQQEKNLILDSAALPLSFEHGYPSINETQPLWEQLPAESPDAYEAYLMFLELPQKSQHENPIRMLPMISTLTDTPIQTVTEWCHLYYWHWRARAYDLFLTVCHRKQREQRIMSIEGKHFSMAEALLQKATDLVTLKIDQELKAFGEDSDAQTETKVKDLISTIKDLVSVQRISVGLPATGPLQAQIKLDGPRNTTPEDTYKAIATEGAGSQQQSQRPQEMDNILANHEDLTRVQEMLVRALKPNHVMPAWDTPDTITIDPEQDDSDDAPFNKGNHA